VVLYELLTGVLPFDRHVFHERSLDEIRRTLRDVDPVRPSTRISQLGPSSAEALANRRSDAGRLAGLLRGDLDWITMKALEKDRARRYVTANALAMDIRRHLSNEPVLASPPSAGYRARKFIRRHRIGVAAVSSVVTLLAVFAVVMTIQAGRIARERDRANREAATARQVSEFLAGLFKVSDPSEARGNSLTAREVLDEGARRIEKELSGQPEIQGRVMALIGDVYANLGLFAQAESVLARSLDIRDRALGPESPDTAASANKLGALFARQGKLAQAEPLFRQALDVRRRLLGREHPDTLTSLSNMSNLLWLQGSIEEAEVYAREALDIRRRTLGPDAPETLDSLNNLGQLIARPNPIQAEAYVREAVTRSRRVQGEEHPKTLWFLRHHAVRLSELKKYHEAALTLRHVLDVQRRVLGPDHPDRLATQQELGRKLLLEGKLSEAEAVLNEVLERRQLLTRGTLHNALRALGNVRIGQERYEEAEQLGRQSLTIQAGEGDKFEGMQLVGHSLLGQGKFVAAEPFLIDYYAWTVRTKDRSGELETRDLIVDLYERWQRPEKAAEWRAKVPK
jgi:eukaryotic-like serine/threonine-protein kinase